MTADGMTMISDFDDLMVQEEYMAAHRLLPPGYPTAVPDMWAHAASALATLDDPNAASDALLQAIMILGHTPDERAHEALKRHIAAGGALADLAELAAEECCFWMESQPEPLLPQQRNYMLN